MTDFRFLSAEPEVHIENAFARPYENSVAAARTCTAYRVILPAEVSGEGSADPAERARRVAQRDAIAESIYEAGHHTTIEHSYVQFRLANISRQFIWTFLHAHPFYNSEQVSQRYVRVKPGSFAVPPLSGEALDIYRSTVEAQIGEYEALSAILAAPVEAEYLRLFPARKGKPRAASDVRKKAQEVARYVLPVATFAHLYHTVNAVTLLRYHRACEGLDAPLEQRIVVGKMVGALLERDPLLARFMEGPIPFEATPEAELYRLALDGGAASSRAFTEEFDAALEGRVSRLVDWKARNEECLASAVREVFGLPRARLSDDDAIAIALDASRNPLLGKSLNLAHHSKLLRALHHPGYTFRKKLSHAADSQDQRHRTVPASHPSILALLGDAPDFIEPELIKLHAPARERYRRAMDLAWDAIGKLRALGVPPEFRAYLLPNATAIRFTESADLQGLHHKLAMRLCYNAQEEIWRASVDEAEEVARINPRIGRHLLPPCGLRFHAAQHPICPEGSRYCGVPAWKLSIDQYSRIL